MTNIQAKWVFEKDVYYDNSVAQMIDFCEKRGVPYQHVTHIPFGSDDHIKWKFGDDEVVIVYGGIGFCRHINRIKRWYPGAWIDFEKLRCVSYLAHWGKWSIHKDYAFFPLKEVFRLKHDLFRKYAVDDHIFIRPDSNDKIFHGELVYINEFEKWYDVAQIYQPAPEQLTLVSRPSRIKQEWRLIVADRKVVTGSGYKHTDDGNVAYSKLGDLKEDNDAVRFAESTMCLTDWQPAPIYTLDLCLIEHGAHDSHNNYSLEYKLLECGSINSSGLYKCDLPTLMLAAEKIAMREWNELNED